MEIERANVHVARRPFPWKIVLIITGVVVLIGLVVGLVIYFTGKSKVPPPSPVSQNDQTKLALSYLTVVYPMVSTVAWKSMNDDAVKNLYQSLCWYYTPMPLDAGTQSLILPEINGKPNVKQRRSVFSRRAPLVGTYWNVSTEAFLADSQDQVQIVSGVSEDSRTFKTNASCKGSLQGWGGIMPNNKFYLPQVESYDTSDSSDISGWWPSYTDPNEQLLTNNPDAKCAESRSSNCEWCGHGDLCTLTKNTPYKNMCYGGITEAAASVFPVSPMGPLWKLGSKPCAYNQLDFTGKNKQNPTGSPAINTDCMKNLYSIKSTDQILGAQVDLSDAESNNRESDKFQMVNIIQPYARKQGCPNFGFMECVAYVAERLGKKLINAPDCSSGISPTAVGALSRVAWCSTKNNSQIIDRKGQRKNINPVLCDPSDFEGCKKSAQNWKENNSIEFFDGLFTQNLSVPVQVDPGVQSKLDLLRFSNTSLDAMGNRVESSNTCSGCCYSSSSNIFTDPDPNMGDLDKSSYDGYQLAHTGTNPNSCVQNQTIGPNCTGGKVMFYWQNGYGKFLNMGLTGVYSNYIGFLLSCPNQPWNATDPSQGPFLRRTPAQVIKIGVASGAKSQWNLFSGNEYVKDRRPYLTGYNTTFQPGSTLRGKSSLSPGTYSRVLKRNIEYKYDFEATQDDYEKYIIIVTGRMYFAKTWGAHILPSKENASVWKNGQIDISLLVKTTPNNWYKQPNVPKHMQSPPGIANCKGLLNPQEGIENYAKTLKTDANTDQLLCDIALHTVQCYYPPNLQITNPSYQKSLDLQSGSYSGAKSYAGVLLWSAMYIMGDSGADWLGYESGKAVCAQVSDSHTCPGYPFGTFYFGANIGGCVYGLTAALGWNSSQFSLMSTGGGSKKTCNYPNYDYEIVYIGGSGLKNRLCRNSIKVGKDYNDDVYGFKSLDFSGNGQKGLIEYYTKYGYVQGSTEGLSDDINNDITCINSFASEKRKQSFLSLLSPQLFKKRSEDDYYSYKRNPVSACQMPLSEINVYDPLWKDNRPNALFYKKPAGKCKPVTDSASYKEYVECEEKGGFASDWPFGITTSGASDCPYRDGGIREQAERNKVTKLFVEPIGV